MRFHKQGQVVKMANKIPQTNINAPLKIDEEKTINPREEEKTLKLNYNKIINIYESK